MSDSVRPHRRQPTRLPRPWDSPGKNTGVGCHCLLQCMKVKSESEVAQSCPTLATPWTAACQASLSFTISWTLLKSCLLSRSCHPTISTLCHLLLLLPSIFLSIRVFSNETALHIRWPNYWTFSISPFKE